MKHAHKNPTQRELKVLADAYTMGDDISLTPEGQAMAVTQADRVIREFRKLQKKIDIEFTDRDPYRNFEEMRTDVESNRRMYVYTGGSETPLWSPQVNWMARAVHDWDHLQGGFDFSAMGEIEAFRYTAARMPQLEHLYLSEIALQAAASAIAGGFPEGPQRLVKAPHGVLKLAREVRRNAKKDRDLAEIVWDAAGMLRFMPPEEMMVHLRQEGVPEELALQVAVAAEMIFDSEKQ